ncbi:MAG: SpoVA/SpoVAEb family sporulation membrane protein [Oscillospiraceae bacterium]|nr:SpoVA/SpoVAEb family sporulation membrane protein [Oscillospiraceae bacterium]
MRPNWTQAESWITGLGCSIFKIVGPVIVYGISASTLYGLIYWITTII